MTSRTRTLTLLLGVLLVVALTASCTPEDAGSEPVTSTSTSSTSSTTSSTTTTAKEPAEDPVDITTSTSAGAGPQADPGPATTPAGALEVHFLDIGQGDATLLVGAGATVLVDAGRHDRSDVAPALRSLGVNRIDLVIITHAHADHIGQLDKVLDQFPVDEVWMSGTPHTTATFQRALDALERSGAAYAEPRSGDVAHLGDLQIEVLNPSRLIGDHHADGLVVRIVHGQVRFLFTGDAEGPTEAAMATRHGGRLAAEIYQVGHHGSRTSSNTGFLTHVQPKVAVYSAGAGNSYGHPHPEAIQRLDAVGAEIYGTPTHGRVTVRSDGASWTVSTAQTAAPPPAPPTTVAARAPPPPAAPPSAGCVNINTANHQELQQIIHIGPDRATQIEQLRPFASVDSLTRVNGIGQARLADIKTQGVACV